MRMTALLAALAAVWLALPAAVPDAAAQDAATPGAAAPAQGEPLFPPEEEDDFTPSHLAAAKRVIDLTGGDQQFDNILPRVAEQVQVRFLGNNPGLAEEIEAAVLAAATELASRRGELSQFLEKVWARRFSEAELLQLQAFFESPLGEKFLRLTPSINAISIGAARRWEEYLSVALVESAREKLRAGGNPL